MIFAHLSELPDTHIFSFIDRPGSVSIPENLLLESLKASLKMRKGALILEGLVPQNPGFDPKTRWQLQEAWIYLAPRSLSLLSKSCLSCEASLTEIRDFLSRS